MAIGYEQARNLMRQLNWRMRVKTICDSVEKIVLFHPRQEKEYTVRMDSGRKLMRECVMSQRLDSMTAVLEYNRSEAEVEKPQWFAVTRWSAEDVLAAAEEQGVTLTEAQAIEWWKRNERRFEELMIEHGNEILSDMDFEEDEQDGKR